MTRFCCVFLALSIEVVPESVIPINFTIVREVVHTFVLELEWELIGIIVLQILFSIRLPMLVFSDGTVRFYCPCRPICWSGHGSRIRSIVAFKELRLQCVYKALVFRSFHTTLECAVKEVPRRVLLTLCVLVFASHIWHCE